MRISIGLSLGFRSVVSAAMISGAVGLLSSVAFTGLAIASVEESTIASVPESTLQDSVAVPNAFEATEKKKNVFGVELLGRGVGVSGFYERAFLSRRLSVGIAVAPINAGANRDTTIVLAPYGNLYFGTGNSRGYLTAGFLGTSKESFQSLQSSRNRVEAMRFGIPTMGAGWEYTTEGGIQFRVAGYGFLFLLPRVGGFLLPWAGGSVAKTF